MRISGYVALGLAATLPAASAVAHHSWSAYDLGESVQIIGTIARVIFQSPHSAIVIDVETADGRRERWTAHWGSPRGLRERGVDSRTLRPGDHVYVSGNPHRDAGERSLRLQSLTRTSDGLRLGGRGGR